MVNKPTSFRITEENFAKLNALAKRSDISLNKMINIIISNYSASEENPKKESLEEVSLLRKELNSQRQRINVLQNQIDYLIKKSKDGRSNH